MNPTALHIKILSGKFSLNMVDEVVAAAAGCNVLFLRSVATQDTKDQYARFANDLTLPSRDGTHAFDHTHTAESTGPYQRILWELRDRNILTVIVDKDLAADETDITYDVITEDAFLRLVNTGSFAEYYAAINDQAEQLAHIIRKRDALVAQQITEKVNELQSAYPSIALQPVLIEELLHDTGPHLLSLLPAAEIEHISFNAPLNAMLDQLPNNVILRNKLANPQYNVTVDEAERALIVFLSVVLYVAGHPELASQDMSSLEMLDEPAVADVILQQLAAVRDCSGDQLHAVAVGLLERAAKL